jgi:hypothetical protein
LNKCRKTCKVWLNVCVPLPSLIATFFLERIFK